MLFTRLWFVCLFACLLAGIANALDLTDRILPRLQARPHCRPQLLHFPPYSRQELAAIVQDRLTQVRTHAWDHGVLAEPKPYGPDEVKTIFCINLRLVSPTGVGRRDPRRLGCSILRQKSVSSVGRCPESSGHLQVNMSPQ